MADVESLRKRVAQLEEELAKASVSAFAPLTDWVSTYLISLFQYFPAILVIFGFISDAISQEFKYSIASIIGILSVIMNYLLGAILRSTSLDVSNIVRSAGCSIPGFEYLDSMFSPQAIVLPSSIFAYILIDFARSRPSSENVGTAMLFFLFLGLQVLAMSMKNCFSGYYGGWYR